MIPSVSVIIPLFNKQSTVVRAIDSIRQQEHADIEIIIVDDGSTDRSIDCVLAIQDERIVVLRQANAGPGHARNAGAAIARSSILAFLDADDEWLPGFLEAGLRAFDEHPTATAYAASYQTGRFSQLVYDKVSRITTHSALLPPPDATVSPDALMIRLDGLHSSSTMVKRSAFAKAGGFYEKDRCLWGEDSYFWGQVLFLGPVFWDPTPRVTYHIEDSDLGYAVKHRSQPRPLTMLTDQIAEAIDIEHRPSFRRLARRMAQIDAVDLSLSGHLWKSIALRFKHGLVSPKAFAGDFKRVLRHFWDAPQRQA